MQNNTETPKQWGRLPRENGVPHSVVAGIVFDPCGEIFLLHRSDKVRSARNAWSILTGCHEVGEPLILSLERECIEEFGIQLNTATAKHIGVYENITTEEIPWHWVLNVFTVKTKEPFHRVPPINLEPDKHDRFDLVPYRVFQDWEWLVQRTWTPKLREFLISHMQQISVAIKNQIQ